MTGPVAKPLRDLAALRDLAVVGLGELLWDEFAGGRRLGGAPANFAVMAARLGVHGILASRLREDEPGRAARALLAGLPVDTRWVQTDAERATGRVTVALEDGQPRYRIEAPSAWDALELTPAWRELAGRADAVCWGTLAQREAAAAEAIQGFVAATRPECLRVFDVNLREPFYGAEAVERSLGKATLLKLNDGELPELLSLCGLGGASGFAVSSDEESALTADARRLLGAYPRLELVALTLGARGSLLVSRDELERHAGVACVVADTVGAGDAFTAALVVARLRGASLRGQSEAANRWGAWVASQAGAMPELPEETVAAMERGIEAAGAGERGV